MRLLLKALAIASVSFLLSAASPIDQPLINSGYPPVRYHKDDFALVAFTSDVEAICGKGAPGYRIIACAYSERRVVIMPNPCSMEFTGEQFARIMCHEMGHIQGWPATHDD